MKKVLFFLTAFLSLSTNIFAEDTYYIKVDDVTIKQGESKTVSVRLYGETQSMSFQGDLALPSNLTASALKNTDRTDGFTTSLTDHTADNGTYQLNTINMNLDTTTGENGGAILTFTITADNSISDGEYTATISNIEISDDNFNPYYPADCTFKITVGASAETETVTLTKEYNTYVPAKDLDFSGVEGIKAYYVTAVTATEATLTEATTVAAGEGIIISGTPDDYEVPVAAEAVTKNTDNLLKTSGIAVNDYILYDGKFVLCSDGELAEGKAYLPASAITSGAKVINIVFGGESTGISEVKKSEADSAIYNLSGMRVSKTQKGVYIMNGRKVIVK